MLSTLPEKRHWSTGNLFLSKDEWLVRSLNTAGGDSCRMGHLVTWERRSTGKRCTEDTSSLIVPVCMNKALENQGKLMMSPQCLTHTEINVSYICVLRLPEP